MESFPVNSHIGDWKRNDHGHYVVCSLRWSDQNGERVAVDILLIIIIIFIQLQLGFHPMAVVLKTRIQ